MILFLDTTQQDKAEIVLAGESKTLKKVFRFDRNLSEKLIPEIQKLFKKAKVNFSDIKKIAVVAGPGSFTGVRIGVAVANALAYSLKVPIIAEKAGFSRSSLLKEKGVVVGQIAPIYSRPPQITRAKKKF